MPRPKYYHPGLLLLLACPPPLQGLRWGARKNPWSYLQLNKPICFTNVPSWTNGSHSNIILTQEVCENPTGLVGDLPDAHARCMARKRSCALVGSSAHLLNASFGPEIDGHEEVVRVNLAPAGNASNGFTGQVGSRTTARFFNTCWKSFRDELLDKDICLFMQLRWNSYQRSMRSKKKGVFGTDFGDNRVFLDRLYLPIARRFQLFPTTGFIALFHLLHTCEEVTVYGFGPSCEGSVGTRYYKHETKPNLRYHSYDTELGVIEKLARTGVVSYPGIETFFYNSTVTMKFPACLHKQDTQLLSMA